VNEFLPQGWGTQGARGIVFVVAGPSGAGKSSVIEGVLARNQGLHFSVSATTRRPRPGEVHGRDYYFVSENQFEEMIRRGELLEWTTYQGLRYGTPKAELQRPLREQRDVLVNVEVQGALALKRAELKHPVVLIFLVPPSWDSLLERIQARGTESPRTVKERLAIAQQEVQYIPEFQYLVVNDVLEEAVRTVEAIMLAERARLIPLESGPS